MENGLSSSFTRLILLLSVQQKSLLSVVGSELILDYLLLVIHKDFRSSQRISRTQC